ncbi:MAG: cytochrome c biogenesis protein CcsA [Bacteroidetes bacterium]|nr:cytochrome c biogenesis protein CcsA [Bacteroidota bacterium]
MKRFLNILFSMEMMSLMLIAFAIAIGTATFIENDFGTEAAKAVVYNATWFEVLLVLLGINLVANVFRYKMWRREKLVIFVFHISFIVILAGAAITRYIGYEGIMSIREGETESTMISEKSYVVTEIKDGDKLVRSQREVLMSPLSEKAYRERVSINDKDFRIRSVRYIPNAQEILVRGNPGEGEPYLVMVVSSGNAGRNNLIIKTGDQRNFLGVRYIFNQPFEEGAFNLRMTGNVVEFNAPEVVTAMAMMGGTSDTLAAGQWHPFEMRKLYGMGDTRIVLTDIYENGKVDFTSYKGKDMRFMNAMIVELESGGQTTSLALRGGKGYKGEPAVTQLNGAEIRMVYGAIDIQLPFSLKLVDFQLDRYPGSNSPSSYASEVILIDERKGIEMPYRIFMNNVLNYGGYRFFQSSYDKDELGTVLSVNKDAAGTIVTYIGYFLMTLGMMLALVVPNTRFALLGKLMRKKAGFVALLMMLTPAIQAQNQPHSADIGQLKVVDKKHASAFGELLVQDHDGRLKPLNTLASEMLRKVSRKTSFAGMNPEQVLIGMQMEPEKWQLVRMIKVSHPELKKFLGITGNHAAFVDMLDFNQGGGYKLRDLVSQAYARKPAERSKFDNDVIAVDERVNIAYYVYTGELLKVFPDPRDSHAPWFTPGTRPAGLNSDDSTFVASAFNVYFSSLASGNMEQANLILEGMKNYQQKYGAEILPSQGKIRAEMIYNRMMIFDRLGNLYGLAGVIMLVLVFMNIFRERKWINSTLNVFYWIMVVFFALQTFGLAMRWYIAGRAPWSNGYESMIYIGWVTVLAGLLFARKSQMTIAATSIMASIILMVAHLAWLDPEITNLVPVLKSYWLTIHVSVITASYGFFALGALLGFMNLIIMIMKTEKNFGRLAQKIKELNYINERTIIIGLYLLTIGTFLGGIWANESWGRYWGWDPKETWALVSVLVYAFVAHMGYVPGLKTDYSFSFATLVSLSAIIMTYFGVNYYLSGLHSYAAGDPVPIPTFVYYTVAIVAIVSITAYLNERRFRYLPDRQD